MLTMLVLEATEIMATLRRFAALVAQAENDLNRINVFPVADRDTGTNLRRTVEAMLAELDDGPQGELGAALALAALNGARGNSGLICAQYVAGLLAVEPERLLDDPEALGRGVVEGALRARAAVAEPVDGTVITVADAAARAAAEWLGWDPDGLDGGPVVPDPGSGGGRDRAEVQGLVAELHRVVRQEVAATRTGLAVLAEAGVVDAGAAGLALWFEALAQELGVPTDVADDDEGITGTAGETAGDPAPPVADGAGDVALGSGSSLVGFEVQFTAEGDDATAGALRGVLVDHGTDVVVSHAGAVLRAHVHVHVSEVGPVLEAVLDVVRPRNLSVEALIEHGPGPVGEVTGP